MHFYQDFDQKDTFVLQLKCSSSEQKHDNYLPKTWITVIRDNTLP